MSVLTAPRNQVFSRQMTLPFAPVVHAPIKAMRGTGSAGPLHEPAARTPLALFGEEQSAGTVPRPIRPPRVIAKDASLEARHGW